MKGIEEVIINNEKVYLKKSKLPLLGWKVVYPWKKEDGKINWFNLITGGWSNLIMVILIVVIALFVFLGFKSMIDPLRIIAEQPLEYCRQVMATQASTFLNNFTFK